MNAQKWEYKIEGFLSEAEMNRLGDEGWELVSADGRSVFRRPKEQQASPARETFDAPDPRYGRRESFPPMPKDAPPPPGRRSK
jgi:hypothetical protein